MLYHLVMEKKMSKINKIIFFIVSFLFFIIFDVYFSSNIINSINFLKLNNPILDLVFVQNTGAAFSLFENSPLFLIVISIISIFLILIYTLKNINKISVFTCYWIALLLAGISCNFYERIVFGYVRDFIKLNFINFPIFNISDIFINIGVIVLIFIIIKKRWR